MRIPKRTNRLMAIALVVVLIGAMLPLGALTGHSQVRAAPSTIYVPDDYVTIQAAVDAANPGDTIIVRDGTYTENVVLDKSIILRGEGVPTIDGGDNGEAIRIMPEANRCTIEGFSVIGEGEFGGWINIYSDYNTIQNNACTGGIGLSLTANGHGAGSIASTIVGNELGQGVFLLGESDAPIEVYTSHTIENNTIGGKPIYYYSNTQGITVPSDAGQILMANCSDMMIDGIQGSDAMTGIQLAYVTDSVIKNSSFSDCDGAGIALFFSSGNTVTGCEVNGSANGIYLLVSDDNLIEDNILTGGTVESDQCAGICLFYSSSGNSIRNNICSNNKGAGVSLRWGGNLDNTVEGNIISKNTYGIYLGYQSTTTVYLNDFVDNTVNAYPSFGSDTTWNSPEQVTYTYSGSIYTNYLGNHWSDYTGSDTDGDGIGDAPYVIDSEADNYPLMEPFENYLLGEPPQAGGWVITTTTALRVRGSLYEGMTHNDDNVIVRLNRGSLLQRLEHSENGKTVDSYTWQYVLLGSSWREAVGYMTGWVANEFLMDYTFPEEPREVYTRLTAYNVPYETEVIGNIQKGVPGWEWDERFDPLGYTTVNIKIYPANRPGWPGYEIGSESRSYNRAFLYSNRGLPMQGSGRDSEGRFIKREGTYGYEDGWIDDEAKIEFYEVKDFPYQAERAPDASHGALGWHIPPWRSIAIDPRGPIPLGSIVYVKELDGARLSNGVMLDGYFIAQDSGSFTDSKWLDLFVGAGDMALKEYFDIVKRKGEYFTVQYHENPSVKQAKLGSPGELRVYDSADRVTGVVNGQTETGIPYSNYNDHESVATVFFAADSYRYVVAGLDEGLYSLMLSDSTGLETLIFHAASIPTSPGAVHQYTVDWDALAQDEDGITIEKDHDGDGEIDETTITGMPQTPTDPSPADNATEVSLDATLIWTGDYSGSVTYNVYFGTSMDPPLVSERQAETTYVPTLRLGTTYYWRVEAINEHGISSVSPLWSFTAEGLCQAEPSPDVGFASIADDLVIVLLWQPATQSWDLYFPLTGDDTIGTLEAGRAYFIYVESDCTLVYGTRVIELYAGWNNPAWMTQ